MIRTAAYHAGRRDAPPLLFWSPMWWSASDARHRSRSRTQLDASVQTIHLAVGTRREVALVRIPDGPGAECHAPQPVDRDRSRVLALELTELATRGRIELGDL